MSMDRSQSPGKIGGLLKRFYDKGRKGADAEQPKNKAAAAAAPAVQASRLPSIPTTHSTGNEEIHNNLLCYGLGLSGNHKLTVGGFTACFSSWTVAGSDGEGQAKENQDSWLIQECPGGRAGLFMGVFDGHGPQGRKVSSSAVSRLPKIMTNLASFQRGSWKEVLAEALPECNAQMRRVATMNMDLSGSTAITAFLSPTGTLTVGNLGDSRCIVGRVADRKLTSHQVTSDHAPDVAEEAQRVLKAGGRICSYMMNNEPVGPLRIWLRDVNVPGLCMTRSLGDNLASTVGVIDIPEVGTYDLEPQDRYILLMSDGIYEFIENQELMEMIHAGATSGLSPHEVAMKLVKEARQRWMENEQDVIDDCTLILVYVQPTDAAAKIAARGNRNWP